MAPDFDTDPYISALLGNPMSRIYAAFEGVIRPT